VKSRIHVNRHIIDRNRKQGENEPPLSIKQRGKTYRAHTVEVLGPSTIVHNPMQPLACGAKVWIETTSELAFTHIPQEV